MNRLLLSTLCTALLTVPTYALVDTNTNGLSDVWEKLHNNDQLFDPQDTDHAPTADPDGDGWTNLQESTAGTNPFVGLPANGPLTPAVSYTKAILEPPAPGSTIGQPASPPPSGDPNDPFSYTDGGGVAGPVLEIRRAARFNLTWPTVHGKAYRVYHSADLETWSPASDFFMGAGIPLTYQGEAINTDNTEPPKLFYRIKVEDADTDGDGLTDWEEGEMETDPLHPDIDRDGISDGEDPAPKVSATYADPDGRGLINAGLTGGLRAHWDFEEPPVAATTLFGETEARAENKGPTAPSWPVLVPFTQGGVPPAQRPGFVSAGIPLTNKTIYGDAKVFQNITGAFTLSFWHKFEKDAVKNSNGIYKCLWSLCANRSGSTPSTINSNTLAIRKKSATEEEIYLGAYTWTSGGGTPHSVLGGISITRPLGTTDDGGWHQFTIVRTAGKYTLLIDGQTTAINQTTAGWLTIPMALPVPTTATPHNQAWHYDWNVFGDMSPELAQNQTLGTFDRIRLWDHALTPAETLLLYRENTDDDGLWDITEVKTALWRDLNSNGIRNTGETTYSSHPLEWQDDDHDTDGDGLSDKYEQDVSFTDINNPDTDGDFMPDGWEEEHDLDPNDPSDAGNADAPDTVNDGDEIAAGADPTDPTDGGQQRPAAERLSIVLGVGDESGSDSEDYVMHIYRIDPETGAEERFKTIRSGGFGEYEEKTITNFLRGETYTFQIDWQSTNNRSEPASGGTPTEAPDYDYTFKVEPQGEDTGFLIDGYDQGKRVADLTKPLLDDDANNVAETQAEFEEKFESRRVVLMGVSTVSADRMFGASMQVLPGLENIQLEITNTVTEEDFGTHSQLFAKAYTSYEEILGPGDDFGKNVSDPRVWFIQTHTGIQAYLCGDPSLAPGEVKITASLSGQELGSTNHTLNADADAAAFIGRVEGLAAGTGLGFPVEQGHGPNATAAAGEPHHWAGAFAVPVLMMGQVVEGQIVLFIGIFDGAIAGVTDDWRMLVAIKGGLVNGGDWLSARAEAYLNAWRADPARRLYEIKDGLTRFMKNQVCDKLGAAALELGTVQGFLDTVWGLTPPGMIMKAPERFEALVGADPWELLSEAVGEWFDDFGTRMLAGAEQASWTADPFPANALITGSLQYVREVRYTAGYAFGYLAEQATLGIASGKAITLTASMTMKGAKLVAENTTRLATRSTAIIAAKGVILKKTVAPVAMAAAMRVALEEGFVLAARTPTPGVAGGKNILSVIEESYRALPGPAPAATISKLVDDIVTNPRLAALAAQPGGSLEILKATAKVHNRVSSTAASDGVINWPKLADRLIKENPGGSLTTRFDDVLAIFKADTQEGAEALAKSLKEFIDGGG